MTAVDVYREPPTTPYGLPVAARHTQAQTVDVYTGGDDEAALEAALPVMRAARQKGFPRAVSTVAVGGVIELSLLWPHLLQWVGMLDGVGHAAERHATLRQASRADEVDAARVAAFPHAVHGDFSVHGWTEVDDVDGQRRCQQWVLRPVNEPGCQRCLELPEPARQPLSALAWRDDLWWRLVGKRWDEPTGPRAHLVQRSGDRPSPRRRTADR